tara:strand:+ start:1674 stop:1832 length:159 start_codon:yes stop_codon:yes gene_type:complete
MTMQIAEDILCGIISIVVCGYIFTLLFIKIHFFVAFLFLYCIVALATIEVEG